MDGNFHIFQYYLEWYQDSSFDCGECDFHILEYRMEFYQECDCDGDESNPDGMFYGVEWD